MKFEQHFDAETCRYLDEVVDNLSDELMVSPHVLEDIIIGEAIPCDDKKWCRTWLKGKRVDTFFSGLDDLYIKAFGCCYPSNVKKVMDQWNTYAAMPIERLRRFFEGDKAFKVKKVYTRSKYLKDIYVILYILKTRKVSIRDMIRTTLRHIKDTKNNFTPRVCWKWNKFGTDSFGEKTTSVQGKVKLMEVGE